jgi:hypothetical protein
VHERHVDGLLHWGYEVAAVGQEMNIATGTEVRVLDMARQVNEFVVSEGGIGPGWRTCIGH